MSILSPLNRFRRNEDGVALVEFAIFLPLFALAFFVVVEFTRVFFSYQGAVVGVRDAARYLARIAPEGICVNAPDGYGDVLVYNNVSTDGDGNQITSNAIEEIVYRNMDNENSALPAKIFIENVASTYVCVVPTDPDTYRQREVPMAQVSARIRIELPLGGILELNGKQVIPDIIHTVTDQSRIYGV